MAESTNEWCRPKSPDAPRITRAVTVLFPSTSTRKFGSLAEGAAGVQLGPNALALQGAGLSAEEFQQRPKALDQQASRLLDTPRPGLEEKVRKGLGQQDSRRSQSLGNPDQPGSHLHPNRRIFRQTPEQRRQVELWALNRYNPPGGDALL